MELDLGVRGKRIVRGELFSHLDRGFVGEASCFVESGQLVQLDLGLQLQLLAFHLEHCPLGVPLRADRHVLADRHRQRARGQPGDAGGEYRPAFGRGRGDADHDAGDRHDPVVGAEHAGAQPVELVGD